MLLLLLLNFLFDGFELLKNVSIEYRLADGVTFVHVASIDTDDGSNPLLATPAFADFLSKLDDRCEEGPVVSAAGAGVVISPWASARATAVAAAIIVVLSSAPRTTRGRRCVRLSNEAPPTVSLPSPTG